MLRRHHWIYTVASLLLYRCDGFDPSTFKLGSSAKNVGSILIDFDNVRGKSGFAYSHQELFDCVAAWTNQCRLQGKVTMVVDHGSEDSTYRLAEKGLTIAFSGQLKADDVIARYVTMLNGNHTVMVITADNGLVDRCMRSGMRQTKLKIVAPLQLLAELEHFAENDNFAEDVDNDDESSSSPLLYASTHFLKLGCQLVDLEAKVRNRAGMNNKRRKKLKQKMELLRKKLDSTEVLHCIQTIVENRDHATIALDPIGQTTLLNRWKKARKYVKERERTGDRVILAEYFRKELESMTSASEVNNTQSIASLPHANSQHEITNQRPLELTKDTLRLVVVSDTHGFENTLTESFGGLPDGDILLHLGDFAVDDARRKNKLKEFDAWLGSQPHKVKIVVRGNHDPRDWIPHSNLIYVTRPRTLNIGQFKMAVLPHLSGRESNRLLPTQCDILVSHVPPKGLLDRCTGRSPGKNAGSQSLRRCVERMKAGPPSLWLCGHIHEARGITKHVFCLEHETTIINAAQANPGIANRLLYGPVVVDITKPQASRRVRDVNLIIMDGQYAFLNQKAESFFQQSAPEGIGELMMAIDLGLRTGLSLFSDEGKLLRYEQLHFSSEKELMESCKRTLEEWESTVNFQDLSGKRWKLTRIAIEGGDPPLLRAWQAAATDDQKMLKVQPEEWRSDLLLPKEHLNGENSKAASKTIAKQIIADFCNTSNPRIMYEDLDTDVAESILLGLHVARRLGWIKRQPAIRRYLSGKAIEPRYDAEVQMIQLDDAISNANIALM